MARVRMYYFNIYSETELLGSVKAETAIKAEEAAADICQKNGTDIHEFTAKRVTSSGAAEPMVVVEKSEGEITPTKEEAHTEENSANKTVTVDFSKAAEEPEPEKEKKPVKRDDDGTATEKQLATYADLKQIITKWDNAKRDGVRTKYSINTDGFMIVKAVAVTKDGTIRKRELIIGRGGAIRAYGKKPRGTEKLMIALKDVERFCFSEKEI